MKNTIILGHNGLFIYVDIDYHGFYHNVNILRHSSVYKNWHQFSTHVDDYFGYFLGDPSSMGEDMFYYAQDRTMGVNTKC